MIELLITAVLLGILEGLTEFIPVSSTGHLILLGSLLDFEGPKAETFEIFIQLGAILAVVVLYYRQFLELIPGLIKPLPQDRGFTGIEGIIKMAVACLPVFIAGFVMHKFIKEHLFNPLTVAISLILGGVVMIWIERRKKEPVTYQLGDLSLKQCAGIGLFQCFALWPGMSRSGATIIGAMLLGADRRIAAEFSFLVAVPVMFVAVGYDMLRSVKYLQASDLLTFGLGFCVSFVVAILAVKLFLAILGRFSLKPFGWYRIGLAAVVLVGVLL